VIETLLEVIEALLEVVEALLEVVEALPLDRNQTFFEFISK
jgi:hypothetical protein